MNRILLGSSLAILLSILLHACVVVPRDRDRELIERQRREIRQLTEFYLECVGQQIADLKAQRATQQGDSERIEVITQ